MSTHLIVSSPAMAGRIVLTACGRSKGEMTRDPTKVTCKACLKSNAYRILKNRTEATVPERT